MKDLLTIPEFAEAAGKKKQGIYTQIRNENSKLFPYVVTQGSKVLIRREALKDVYGIEQGKSQTSQTQSQISQIESQISQAESQIKSQTSQISQTESQAESQTESQESQTQSQTETGQEQNIIAFLQEQISTDRYARR